MAVISAFFYNWIVWSSRNVITSTTHFLPHPLLFLPFYSSPPLPPLLPSILCTLHISPCHSLHSNSQLDINIKGQLVRDILNLAGFTLPTKESSGDM